MKLAAKLYAHPATGEIKQAQDWIKEYYDMYAFDCLEEFFGYELDEGESFPMGTGQVLAFMAPINEEILDSGDIEFINDARTMRLR